MERGLGVRRDRVGEGLRGGGQKEVVALAFLRCLRVVALDLKLTHL